MTLASAIARGGCAANRALVALHPLEFRDSFGTTVIDETAAEIAAAVPAGAAATTAAVARALVDAGCGVLLERAAQIEAWRRAMKNAFMSDLRLAVRTLLRDRGFTAVAVGTLSTGLALCVTVAVLVNAYLVRGLPFPESHRLFDVQYGSASAPPPPGMETLDWHSLDDVLELGMSWDLDSFTLRGGAYPDVLQGTWVTPGYVEGFAVRPFLGRGFVQADFEPGRPMAVLISHRLWQARFNGDPSVLGRTFQAHVSDRPNDAETFTVIGVLAPGHWHLNVFTEVLAPLRAPSYPYLVRVREGVPPATAADRIAALVRAGAPGLPAGWRVELRSTHDTYVQQIRPLLLAVATATGLVLLIACANVSVLLTVRATRRRREMAVRQALGASAAQITRACAAEPLLLGAVATALGFALAWATIVAIAPVMNHYLGRPAPGGVTAVQIDPATTALAVAAGLLAIAMCSLLPIWVVRRTPVSLALSSGQKGGTDGPGQRRARAVLIAVEVAACLTLLVGAGLTIQSAVRMLRVDMGLDATDVLVTRFALNQRAYPDAPARGGFYERAAARAGELTGVAGVAFTNAWPLQQSPIRDVAAGDIGAASSARAGLVAVSPDYFNVLRIPLRDGRGFTPGDRVGSEPVALVSQTLASRLWPSGSPIDQPLRIAPPSDNPRSGSAVTVRVVGVVGDIRHTHTDDDLADAYLPIFQRPSASVFTYVRVSGDPSSAEGDLRRLLASIDSEVGLGAPRQLAEILDLQRAGSRLLGYLLATFAAFAAGLALVGIYGVIAYTVKQREREIAVRLAMGADRGLIMRMFVGQGAIVLAAGLAFGVAGAVGLGRVLRSQLFGVEPADPVVIAGMTAAFALCGLLAIAWPARSAASLDPANALKE